ncbi:tumor necrosis factor receptor superfamily member 17 [Engraulis encrasicolus]|uniref:tumor necrosis factor receptor superfamily member 17 n=1 Tax=Engraulis encrasicolus TaxID=184585 RepID=UPI002FD3A08D
MLSYLGLLVLVLVHITPLSLADAPCPSNQYYDSLSEECESCVLRCGSPPSVCTAFCAEPEAIESSSGSSIRVVLVILFVFLGVAMTLAMTLILQFLRRKTCKTDPNHRVPCQEERGPTVLQEEEALDIPEGTGGALADFSQAHHEGQSGVTPNSSLPLPSTEEGTTVLVTTKTGQSYNSCRWTQNTGNNNRAHNLFTSSGFVP